MRHPKTRIITVQEDEKTTTNLELTQQYLEFYKKETGHAHVTDKGLSKFVTKLLKLFHCL